MTSARWPGFSMNCTSPWMVLPRQFAGSCAMPRWHGGPIYQSWMRATCALRVSNCIRRWGHWRWLAWKRQPRCCALWKRWRRNLCSVPSCAATILPTWWKKPASLWRSTSKVCSRERMHLRWRFFLSTVQCRNWWALTVFTLPICGHMHGVGSAYPCRQEGPHCTTSRACAARWTVRF